MEVKSYSAAPQVTSSPRSMQPSVSMEFTGVVRQRRYTFSRRVMTSAMSSIPLLTWSRNAPTTSSNDRIAATGGVAAPMRERAPNCRPSFRACSRQIGRLKSAASEEL